jgi:arylsulfatase
MSKKPNIIFIMSDQHRADALGCMGDPVVKTPCLDRLAGEGVRMTNAYSPGPVCMPFRASLITGLYPHLLNMWANGGILNDDIDNLYKQLKAQGYTTAHIGKTHYVHEKAADGNDLLRYEDYMHRLGIDYIHETTCPGTTADVVDGTITHSHITKYWEKHNLLELYKEDHEKRRNSGGVLGWQSARSTFKSLLPEEHFLDTYICDQSIQFINNYDGTKPLFLIVSFGGPHPPWDAPGEYADMYSPDAVPPPVMPDDNKSNPGLEVQAWIQNARCKGLAADEYKKPKANYYGKITLIDKLCGRVLDSLKKKNLYEDSFIAYFSDHGEMLGDHQLIEKGCFFEGSARIPMIVRYPAGVAAGTVSRELHTALDLHATALKLSGAETRGRSFGVPMAECLPDSDGRGNDYIYSVNENWGVMVRDKRYKYAINPQGMGYSLFDMEADPTELNNLIGQKPELEHFYREKILQFFMSTRVTYTFEGALKQCGT